MSGEANETQISEALKRYSERAFFVREALFHLFSLTHVMEKTKPEILKVKEYSFGDCHALFLKLSPALKPGYKLFYKLLPFLNVMFMIEIVIKINNY